MKKDDTEKTNLSWESNPGCHALVVNVLPGESPRYSLEMGLKRKTNSKHPLSLLFIFPTCYKTLLMTYKLLTTYYICCRRRLIVKWYQVFPTFYLLCSVFFTVSVNPLLKVCKSTGLKQKSLISLISFHNPIDQP